MSMDITSRKNHKIIDTAKLLDSRHRRSRGMFLAEGRRHISRALMSGFLLSEIFVCPLVADISSKKECAALFGLPELAEKCYLVSSEVLQKISYQNNPEGIVAVFSCKNFLFDDIRLSDSSLVLVCAGMEKPGNIGAMLRSADACGADAFICADLVSDIYNPNCIRASTGAVFTLPVICAESETVINYLIKNGFSILVTSPENGIRYTAADMCGKTAVVIGPEDTGLHSCWLENKNTVRVTIPMYGSVTDSLNASVSAALMLFEAVRQRQNTATGSSDRKQMECKTHSGD